MAEGTTLPAGRELDALVAERVFGWEWKLDQDTRGDGFVSPLYRVICDPKLWGDFELLGRATGSEPARIDRPYNGQNPPHYSTDIAAAWAVLEKLRADGTIDMASVSVGEHGWWCVLYPPLGYGQPSVESDYCDTAAEAICYAALATLPPAGAR